MWIYFSKKVLYLNAQYSRGFLFFVLFFNGEKFCFYIFPFSFKIIADLLLTDRVAHLVKSPLPMQKTWVQSLGWEDSLGNGKATHSSILTWTTQSMDCKELDTTEQLSLSH